MNPISSPVSSTPVNHLDLNLSEMSPFAKTQYNNKYAWKNEDGEITEEWADTAKRVVHNVLGALGYDEDSPESIELVEMVSNREFMPGGRYLYASGRPLHQTQNCMLMRAEDSREGWAELTSNSMMALQTGAGIGIDYSSIRESGAPIRKTGGLASGPIPLMNTINEAGRGVMQGGARRSAIWAGLNWQHDDILEFIYMKDWDPRLVALKEEMAKEGITIPLPMEFTNISILLDDEFFEAYDDQDHEKHELAKKVYHHGVKEMVKKAEPGFSVDIGENAGETLRNAPVTASTNVLTDQGYKMIGEITDSPATVWTGEQWAEDVVFERTWADADILCVSMTGGREIRCDPSHEFLVEEYSGAGERRKLEGVTKVKAIDLAEGDVLHVSLPEVDLSEKSVDKSAYTLGYIYGDGSFHTAGGADLSLCSEGSKGCADLITGHNSVNAEDGRGYTRYYFSVNDTFKGRGKAQFPNDVLASDPKYIASFMGGLFDADGNWEPQNKAIRLSSVHKSFLDGTQRALEQIGIISNISTAGQSTFGRKRCWQLVIAAEHRKRFADVIPTRRLSPDLDGYKPYRPTTIKVLDVFEDGKEDVFCADVKVPEHSFMAEGVIISNCTEVTSADDSDVCNLGSINLSRIRDKEHMERAVRLGTLFLMSGTVYSHLPYDKVSETRRKNRRLGLGLMGIHEWLLQRGKKYGPDGELAEWFDIYATSGDHAEELAHQHNLSVPVKTRAIAPTGTIGIVAETTTGIEPIFCVAYKRRVKEAKALGGDKTSYQYVVDPTAKRLMDAGADPLSIEDAYSMAYNYEKRIDFQAWVQQWVDHGISSTINLPEAITDPDEVDDFAEVLYKHLPSIRGITVYPDGSRGMQPLTAVPLEVAVGQEGVVFEEDEANACSSGSCGA